MGDAVRGVDGQHSQSANVAYVALLVVEEDHVFIVHARL